MSTELVPTVSAAPMSPAERFELMQRQAKLFASSPLVPAHIADGGSQKGLANCYIALVLAEQMGENPLVVMQNIYIVHGRAGWSASYMIAKANASGVFKGVIRFKHSGTGKDRVCTASGTLKDTGEDVEATASMAMAEAEGWAKNSKYRTMPDQMLIYRAATFLVRTYCPQVMLGYHTSVELEDMAAAAPETPRLTIASVVGEPQPKLEAAAEAEPIPVAEVPKAKAKKSAEEPTDDQLPGYVVEAGELGLDWLDFLGRRNLDSIDALLASEGEERKTHTAKLFTEIRELKAKGKK